MWGGCRSRLLQGGHDGYLQVLSGQSCEPASYAQAYLLPSVKVWSTHSKCDIVLPMRCCLAPSPHIAAHGIKEIADEVASNDLYVVNCILPDAILMVSTKRDKPYPCVTTAGKLGVLGPDTCAVQCDCIQ